MKYFKDELNQIFAYDDEQVQQGYGADLLTITEAEKDELLAPSVEELEAQAKANETVAKTEALSKLTVTTSSGKVFYADTESRVDLNDAIRKAEKENILETVWKLAEEFEGEKLVIVTLEEIREAADLALIAKGTIVGVIQIKEGE